MRLLKVLEQVRVQHVGTIGFVESLNARACSNSPKQNCKESQMDELQAGVELALAVLPQSSVFLQPRKAALDDLAFWYDVEGIPLAALGYLHRHMLPPSSSTSLQIWKYEWTVRHLGKSPSSARH